jgi:hypothetical protein
MNQSLLKVGSNKSHSWSSSGSISKKFSQSIGSSVSESKSYSTSGSISQAMDFSRSWTADMGLRSNSNSGSMFKTWSGSMSRSGIF